jgi:hypothetical protein
MEDQMAVAAVEQQVLAAAPHRSDPAPGERVHFLRYRPAQPRLAHRHAGDEAPGELRGDAAARHLDFGKLGHVQRWLVRGTKYT